MKVGVSLANPNRVFNTQAVPDESALSTPAVSSRDSWGSLFTQTYDSLDSQYQLRPDSDEHGQRGESRDQ